MAAAMSEKNVDESGRSTASFPRRQARGGWPRCPGRNLARRTIMALGTRGPRQYRTSAGVAADEFTAEKGLRAHSHSGTRGDGQMRAVESQDVPQPRCSGEGVRGKVRVQRRTRVRSRRERESGRHRGQRVGGRLSPRADARISILAAALRRKRFGDVSTFRRRPCHAGRALLRNGSPLRALLRRSVANCACHCVAILRYAEQPPSGRGAMIRGKLQWE